MGHSLESSFTTIVFRVLREPWIFVCPWLMVASATTCVGALPLPTSSNMGD